MPQPPARQPLLGDRPGAPRIMMTGRRPALAALPRTLSSSCIKEMQRRPVPEPILVIEMDTTVELPAKPDSGSAGSSKATEREPPAEPRASSPAGGTEPTRVNPRGGPRKPDPPRSQGSRATRSAVKWSLSSELHEESSSGATIPGERTAPGGATGSPGEATTVYSGHSRRETSPGRTDSYACPRRRQWSFERT